MTKRRAPPKIEGLDDPPKIEGLRVPPVGEVRAAVLKVFEEFRSERMALYEVFLEHQADEYERLAYRALNERVAPVASPAVVARQLADISRAANALARALAASRTETSSALYTAMSQAAEPTRLTIADLEHSAFWLAGQAELASRMTAQGSSRARWETIHEIAAMAAQDYRRVTGERASRSRNRKAFREFLAGVFQACGLDRLGVKSGSYVQAAIAADERPDQAEHRQIQYGGANRRGWRRRRARQALRRRRRRSRGWRRGRRARRLAIREP